MFEKLTKNKEHIEEFTEVEMLVIPLTDFTHNVETYLDKAVNDEIIIEKDGKPYITLSKALIQKTPEVCDSSLDSLYGILKDVNVNLDDIKFERISRK